METSQIEHLKISVLCASPWNRPEDGNGELKELAESIKLHGILQPILVRGGNEIVAGHRRWKAAKLAGLDTVPCIVVTLSDQDAKLAQIVENLHRKNLNPIEEATAFNHLASTGINPQGIAEMAGKNTKYVYRALELLRLPKNVIKALQDGQLTAAHGHQLARVGPKQIEMIAKYALTPDWHKNMPTVQELKYFISQRAEKELTRAPFPTDKPYAEKIACTNCPYNTGNQDVLFDDPKEGRCTNGACFQVKCNQVVKDLKDAGEKKWPGIKFLGAARAGYSDNPTIIKGHVVVEVNAKIKAAMEKTPEKFGFGIVKPNTSWGAGGKTYKLGLAVSDATLSGASRDRDNGGYVQDPYSNLKWEWIREYTNKTFQKELLEWNKLERSWDARRAKMSQVANKEWEKVKADVIAAHKKKETEAVA